MTQGDQSYSVGDEVLIEYIGTSPAPARVVEIDPTRPWVLRVIYLHSRTSAWVARARLRERAIVDASPARVREQLLVRLVRARAEEADAEESER